MEDEDQMIFENIDEFINDEMKIVTYKWLSLTLSLNVNKARSFLEEYLKKTDHQLDVIYFVGGKKKDALYPTLQYKLARKSSLDDVKSAFDEVTTCHIYSIQKSEIKDADVLYANDVDIVKESLPHINKHSTIQCDFVTKRSQDIIVPPVTNGYAEHKNDNFKPIQKEEIKKPQPVKQSESKSKDKKKESLKKETTATSFFGKKGPGKKAASSTSKPEDTSKQQDKPIEIQDKVDKPTEKKEKTGGKSKVGSAGISSAFAKSKKTTVDTSKPENAPKQEKQEVNEPMEIDSKTSDDAEVEDISTSSTKKTVQSEKKEDIVVEEEIDSPVKNKKHSKKKKERDISPESDEEIDAPVKSKKHHKNKKERAITPVSDEEIDSPVKNKKHRKNKKERDVSPVNEEEIDAPVKNKKHHKNKKEKETSPVKEEEVEIESVPKEDEKSKEKVKPGKRKAVVSDSESDEDNFEQFLSKSKEPAPKRPVEKKLSKPVYIIPSCDAADDDDDDGDDEEVIPSTPEPEKKKTTKRRKTEKNESRYKELTKDKKFVDDKPVENNDGKKKRGRRMVLKSKQYADEEGFMITKKEYESESFTDESDTDLSEEKIKALSPERKKEVEKKKVVINLEKKAKEHSSKPKHQASLMNFFKKK